METKEKRQGHPRFYEAIEFLKERNPSQRYQQLLDEAAEVHARKNAGYAGVGAKDPLINFRVCEQFGIPAWKGAFVRWTDKLIRIQNLNENSAGDLVGESMLDTLLDLSNYSLLILILIEEEAGEKFQYKLLSDAKGMEALERYQTFVFSSIKNEEYSVLAFYLFWYAQAAIELVIELESKYHQNLNLTWLEESK